LLPGDPLQVIKRFVKIAGIPNLEKFFQKEREKTAFAVSWAISYFLAGVRATLYSASFISLGTPMSIFLKFSNNNCCIFDIFQNPKPRKELFFVLLILYRLNTFL